MVVSKIDQFACNGFSRYQFSNTATVPSIVQYVLVVAVDKTSRVWANTSECSSHRSRLPPYATVLLAQRPTASASPIQTDVGSVVKYVDAVVAQLTVCIDMNEVRQPYMKWDIVFECDIVNNAKSQARSSQQL
jgi:hypothetical protein